MGKVSQVISVLTFFEQKTSYAMKSLLGFFYGSIAIPLFTIPVCLP